MVFRFFQPQWTKRVALLLVGLSLQFLVQAVPAPRMAQSTTATACASLAAPLTAEEQRTAKIAWQYFVNNYQPNTGFTNSVGNYPSGSLWDMGNYLMALNAVRWLNLIDQAEFDNRLNKFLTTLSNLKLFENSLPNKTYQAATGELVDYNNKAIDRGIGWSALDIGRMLAAFHVIRTCHPQYNDWLKGIVAKWQVARSIKDGELYGAMVMPDGQTLLVQEGRLGYEEYAVRGYELWGFKADKALRLKPFKYVDVNGVQIPVDTRDFQTTNGNNYVVSESYILDGIEFGFDSKLADYAARVLEAQKRRYEATGILTGVTEDNLDQAPYFIYNSVYANGQAWAPITEKNESFPQFRSLSTKAAFGWRYLFPNNAYAQKLFEATKTLASEDGGGYYAGRYETSQQPNKVLTGNTNGLILEILYYKARGNKPLIGTQKVAANPTPSEKPASPSNPASNPLEKPISGTSMAKKPIVAPIPPVGAPQSSALPVLSKPLSLVERRYAETAWRYFAANVQPETGLVNDRSNVKGATLWGMGDYLVALHAARSLDIITPEEFEQRTRLLLGAIAKLPLFAGELPNRAYDTQTLKPTDYGRNATDEGTGWSSLDVGRLLAALHTLKTYHPQYTHAVDRIVLDWSFLRAVRDRRLFSAVTTKDANDRVLTRIRPETRLGYEEYAARAFQLWGFEVDESAVGGNYQSATVEGIPVPIFRKHPDEPAANSIASKSMVVSDPFVLYGLEFGFDPQMRSLIQPMLSAQAERYRRTQVFTASATTLIDRPPYIVHNTIFGQGTPWATVAADGKEANDARLVSTAAAFTYHALFPEDPYAVQLRQTAVDLYNPMLGYYEGFYEKTGKTAIGFSSSTNSLILQALLYAATHRTPLAGKSVSTQSPWWQAIAAKQSDRGLPSRATTTARFISDASGSYWISETRQSQKILQK
jgi:hypothetical protein